MYHPRYKSFLRCPYFIPLRNWNMTRDNLKTSLLPVVTLLKYLGMWPENTTGTAAYWTYTLFMLVFFQIPMAAFPIVNLFLDENVDILRVASCIFLNLQVSIVPFKTVFLLVFHNRLRSAAEILGSKTFNSYTNEQQAIIQEEVAAVKRNFNYVPLCFVTAILLSAPPLANLEERQLLMDMWFPFNPRENLFNYISVYLFTFIGKSYHETLLLLNMFSFQDWNFAR